MVKNTLERTVEVENMVYIPLDGITYPLFLTTANPCFEELIVTIEPLEVSHKTLVKIIPSKLRFTKR